MSRSLADSLLERLLDAFPATRAYARADWDGDAMPGPVSHFLRQLLHHYSRREARRLRRARSKWVDYDHPDMETAVRTFFDAVEAHTRVPADEWEDTLRQATYYTTDHLVRPVQVLTDFVYAEQRAELHLPEILWRMNFFGPYAYLREAVHAFAKKRDLEALGPDRFDRFLHRIDERITAGYDADRWLRLLDPLFDVARRATDREQVPVALVQSFFAEKRRGSIEQRLETYADEGHEHLAPRALHRLIKEARAGDATGPSSSTPTEQTSTPKSAPEAPAEPSGPPSEEEVWGVAGAARPEGHDAPQSSSDEEESVPLWKRFQQGRTGPRTTSGESGDGRETKANDRQEPLWARFRHGGDRRLSDAVADEASPEASSPSDGTSAPNSAPSAAPPSSRGSSDLAALERQVLGVSNPPHRAVYVRQLFGGDQSSYQRVLQRLSDAESWGEASQIIASDIFRAHKVNIYSDAAVHFTNAVESRFRGG